VLPRQCEHAAGAGFPCPSNQPPQKLSPQPHNKNSTTASFLLSYNRPKSSALPSTFFKLSHRQNFLTIGKKFCKFRHPEMTHKKVWIE
jgi:hypothetical protein